MDTSAGDSTSGAMISAGDGVSGYGVGVRSVGAAQAVSKERRKHVLSQVEGMQERSLMILFISISPLRNLLIN